MRKAPIHRYIRIIPPILEEDPMARVLTDRESILEISQEFYKKLYSSLWQDPDLPYSEESEIHHQYQGFLNIESRKVEFTAKQYKKERQGTWSR